jgi:hypothetical protein
VVLTVEGGADVTEVEESEEEDDDVVELKKKKKRDKQKKKTERKEKNLPAAGRGARSGLQLLQVLLHLLLAFFHLLEKVVRGKGVRQNHKHQHQS